MNGGGSTLAANQTAAETFETFTILKQNGTGTVVNGNSVALRSSAGYYVVAEATGGPAVNCGNAVYAD